MDVFAPTGRMKGQCQCKDDEPRRGHQHASGRCGSLYSWEFVIGTIEGIETADARFRERERVDLCPACKSWRDTVLLDTHCPRP